MSIQRPRSQRQLQVLQTTDQLIRLEVSENRTQEIERYLKLFGYKPDRTILQVHIAGYFGRGKRRTPKQISQQENATARYGGHTFVVVGRTHDPDFLKKLILPRKNVAEANPGYAGYLFKKKDKHGKPPHELLPLDFVPAELNYPKEWKDMFGTRGYLITMHVPTDFAPKKNNLTRHIRKLKGKTLIKEPWGFLDELENYGYERNLIKRTTLGKVSSGVPLLGKQGSSQ